MKAALVTHNPPDGRETFKLKGVAVMRRQSIAIAGILTLALATAAMAADPLVGTWKLNVAKSKTTDPSVMPKSETIKIVGIDNGFKQILDGVNADGKAYHFEASRILDGKEYPIKDFPSLDMSSAKRIDANTILLVAKKAGKEMERFQITVSKDGKTQTTTVKETNSKGQKVSSTLVYDKQ